MPVTVTVQRPNLRDGDVIDAAQLASLTAINVSVDGAVAQDEFAAYKTQAAANVTSSIAALVMVPVGAIVPYAGIAVPTNWWSCEGQEVSRISYPQIFAVVGTRWGAGDGSTTFNLPDLRGRTLVGMDTSSARVTGATNVGITGGAQTVALTAAQMPAHTHAVDPAVATTISAGDHRHMVSDKVVLQKAQTGYPDEDIYGNGYHQTPAYAFPADDPDRFTTTAPAHTHTVDIPSTTTTSVGSGQAHENMPPYGVIRWIIRIR
jgi:microcystin-dependent protein